MWLPYCDFRTFQIEFCGANIGLAGLQADAGDDRVALARTGPQGQRPVHLRCQALADSNTHTGFGIDCFGLSSFERLLQALTI